MFRYGLIAPILNNHCDRKAYLQEVCVKKHSVPYYGFKEFSLSTVERWLSEYRKWGFERLKPKSRADKGRGRALSSYEQEVVLELQRKNMHLSMTAFYDLAIKCSVFEPQNVSYHSVNRLLSNNQMLRMGKDPTVQCKRFSYDTVSTLWQGDCLLDLI